MKIAFSADLHLTSQTTHPERTHALEAILECMLAEGIRTLINAGDLFVKKAGKAFKDDFWLIPIDDAQRL